MSADRRDLEADLRRAIGGQVRFDPMTRALYSTDASNYQIEPQGVVLPRDADDVAAAIETCARHGASVVPRAGGSSLAGQAIGHGVVLDFSAHMHDVVVDPAARVARVGPGAVLDHVNRAASAHGLTYGPNPASSDRACVGGVVANNSTGAHSIVHGMAVDHLRAANVVLADGSRARLAPTSRADAAARAAGDGPEAPIYATLLRIVDGERDTVRRGFPAYWRRAGGYNLDRLVAAADDGLIDAGVLLAGSEGTLAVATGLEVGLVPVPPARGLLVAHFSDPLAPFHAVPALLETGPSAIELVDRMLLGLTRDAPGYADDVAAFVTGDPAALLLIEYAGQSQQAVRAALDGGLRVLARSGACGAVTQAIAPADQARVWRTRKAGLGLLMRMRGDWKPVAGIEDTAVPPDRLADYMAAMRTLLDEAGVRAAFYAHASAGCIHIRPVLNLKTAEGVATLEKLAEETFRLVLKFGGVVSSEHGDGMARGHFNRRQFGDEVYRLFKELKRAFDPKGLLNPGKVLDCPAPMAHLRYGPGYRAATPAARFAYPADGDMVRAVEQCNGAGVCRKLDGGSMCPSYMVTRDEEHSTRGRANALRAVLDGRLAPGAMASDRLREVMALCVGCKACQTECPSGVDMARLKIEVSAARHAADGAPLRSRLFAAIHDLDRRLAPVASLANRMLGGPPARLGARWLGLAPERALPPLAAEPFDRWWARRSAARGSGPSNGPSVVLFADTFATFHEPGVARAAVAVLEAAGYRIIVPPRRCCGRPALSQGLVDRAVAGLRANVAVLAPLAQRGLPILVPEPSCASVFRDELPDLLTEEGERGAASIVAQAVQTLDEFVAALPAGSLPLRPGPARALLHVHCHQRALVGTGPSVTALERIPGLAVEEPDAGCCGMAGAFGYEAEHYAVSLAMAERRLAPAVRGLATDVPVLAAGTSCRHQIADTTGRRAEHPVELLARQLMDRP